jgi:predicted transcriptional regulator
LVSPELHQYEYKTYWLNLKKYITAKPTYNSKIHICTDYPMIARDFFKNE